MSLRAFRNHQAPRVEGSAENLCQWLVRENHPAMQAIMGQETVMQHCMPHLAVEGEKFSNRTGTVQAWRFLRLSPDGQDVIGCLQATCQTTGRKKEMWVSNLVVSPSHRRQGVATGLLDYAEHVLGRTLQFDAALSQDGAAWAQASYATTPPSPRGRRP